MGDLRLPSGSSATARGALVRVGQTAARSGHGKGCQGAQLEAVPRPVIAVGNRCAAGHRHPSHRHRRAQLLVAESGAMLVDTSEGAWMIPPGQALWIPGGVNHGMTMLSLVATCSAYLEPAAAPGLAGRCRVVGISPLLRQLLIEAVDLPAEYDPASRDGRVMSLLIDEIRRAPGQALRLPLPDDARLAASCRRFLARPNAQDTIDQWSHALAMSRRTFTRLFRRETGLSFAEWQRRACLLASLPRLANGERITTIAYDLGYAGPAAFTAMFKQFGGYRRTPGAEQGPSRNRSPDRAVLCNAGYSFPRGKAASS